MLFVSNAGLNDPRYLDFHLSKTHKRFIEYLCLLPRTLVEYGGCNIGESCAFERNIYCFLVDSIDIEVIYISESLCEYGNLNADAAVGSLA